MEQLLSAFKSFVGFSFFFKKYVFTFGCAGFLLLCAGLL